jgi:ABC-type nitrate/sulfonate/bicarbonate transport system permease component
MNRIVAPLLFALGLLLLWQAAAELKVINPIFFPSPGRTLVELYAQTTSGRLWQPLGATTLRMIYGWVLASVLGIVLGAAIASSRAARDYLEPTLDFLRPLPASAIIPVAILFLGLSNGMSTAVIAFGSLWPVLLGTVHGFKSVQPELIELSASLRLSRWEVLRKIALPAALPDILAGARISLAIALILAVVTEMQASLPGLGQNILLAQRSYRSPELYAGIVVLGLMGFAANQLLLLTEKRMLRWRAVAV